MTLNKLFIFLQPIYTSGPSQGNVQTLAFNQCSFCEMNKDDMGANEYPRNIEKRDERTESCQDAFWLKS